MNILMTGGTGYLGSHILSKLSKRQNKIILIDKTKDKKKLNILSSNYLIYSSKINYSSLLKIFRKHNIDCVIHLASNIKQKNNNVSLFKDDLDTLILIIKFLKIFKTKFFLYSSSCDVYGNNQNIKLKENFKCKPISNYGKSKLKLEKTIKLLLKNTKTKYQILRIFNLIGFEKNYQNINIFNRSNFISNIIKNYQKRKTLKLYGYKCKSLDGSCVRDYLHISDFAKIFISLLNKIKKIKSGVVNIGSSVPLSNLEIIKQIEMNNKIIIPYSNCKKRKNESSHLVADNNKLKSIINLKDSFFKRKLNLSSYNIFFK